MNKVVTRCKTCGKAIKLKDPKFGKANSYLKYNFNCEECYMNLKGEGVEIKVYKPLRLRSVLHRKKVAL